MSWKTGHNSLRTVSSSTDGIVGSWISVLKANNQEISKTMRMSHLPPTLKQALKEKSEWPL